VWIKDILVEKVHEYQPEAARSHRTIIRKIAPNQEQTIKLRSSYRHPSEPKGNIKKSDRNNLNFIMNELHCGY
jgi:hypothetical protein